MHNVCVNDHRHQTTNIHLNQLQIYLILRHSPEKSENIHKRMAIEKDFFLKLKEDSKDDNLKSL